jgi:nucleoside-diphosphate-sugar epimerase
MRILLTGSSSFTGSWFASSLAKGGHQVTATFRGSLDTYSGIRRTRIDTILPHVEAIWGLEFGDDRFLEVVRADAFDIFCHHAAEMSDYRSWGFDPLEASRKNTRNARAVLTALSEGSCRRAILTGSVFEPYEGIGDRSKRAFNPYGLSKHISFEIFRMEAERIDLHVGKFVIPNPFGPLEEGRFTTYLAKEWIGGRVPTVATPVYIRDNIHVSLLACSYRAFCENQMENADVDRATPSGYIESQGAFARRFASELGPRLGFPCEMKLADQSDFPEPLIRTNKDSVSTAHPEWSESTAWDELAMYYSGLFVTA